jgi:hypothetical protein
MMGRGRGICLALLGAILCSSVPALVQTAAGQSEGDEPPPARVRIVLNGAFWLGGGPTFGDTRRLEEYAEQTTIRTSYETRSAFGPDVSVQATVFRDLGILVGYSYTSRDESGSVDVSRPHPLYLDRPRAASADISGYGYSENTLHLDLAYGRTVGHLDWSLFAGVTLFRVKAELLSRPTYTDVYPYDDLTINATPGETLESSPTGFNVGGRLDYRFGGSGRFGLGVQLLYSTAAVELQANPEAERATFDAGGLQAAAGVRLFF